MVRRMQNTISYGHKKETINVEGVQGRIVIEHPITLWFCVMSLSVLLPYGKPLGKCGGLSSAYLFNSSQPT
jgi:hypothetical protein